MTKEEQTQKINEIIGYGGGIHYKVSDVLLLSGEFRDKANDEIKLELKKLGRAAVLLRVHERLLSVISSANEYRLNIRVDVDRMRHMREEEDRRMTLRVHTGNIHIDSQVEPIISREREIEYELKELDVDYSMLISWIKNSIEK